MATSTQNLPKEVQSTVESYLELTPGVHATKRNLKTLLDSIEKRKWYGGGFTHRQEKGDDFNVCLRKANRQKKIVAEMGGEQRNVYVHIADNKLCMREFAFSEDELLEAIVYLKAAVRKFNAEGVCQSCKTLHFMRMKADGMPYCAQCMFNKAIGV